MGYLNKCTHMTLFQKRMNTETEEKAIFPSPGSFNSEQFSPPHLLWFKIITMAFQTNPSNSQVNQCDVGHNQYWPLKGRQIQRCVFCKNAESETKFRCPQCKVQLCARPHFKLYHVKLHF
jgi:hypothetical protein